VSRRASEARTLEIFAVVLAAGTCFAIAQTLVVPALPEITEKFDTSATSASWLFTGFLLSAAVATPIAGKLGDVYGKGRVLAWVLLIYAAGGVICALANGIEPMIGGRVLQGVSGGVYPLAYATVKETFPPEKVPNGLSMVSVLVGFGGAVGLLIAGPIIDHLGIPWLFWTSLIALPTAAAALVLIPSTRAAPGTRVDWPGAALLSAALTCALLAITRANDWGWVSAPTIGLLVAGVALSVLWLRFEGRVAQPIMELRLLRQPTMLAVNLAALLLGSAVYVGFLLIPQIAHAPTSTGYGFGYSVTEAGLMVLPLTGLQLGAGPLASVVGKRIGFRATLILGTGLASISLALLAATFDQVWGLLVCGAGIGIGIAFAFAALANLVVDSVPAGDVGIATGINTVSRTVGGAFGTAIATAILTSGLQASTGLAEGSGYAWALAVAAAGGIAATLAALCVPARRLEKGTGGLAPLPPELP
jgi:MFS family permease